MLRTALHRALVLLTAALGGVLALPSAGAQGASPPAVRHVFVINLENKGYDETFRASSPAPYLSRELRAQGQLLTQFYGVAHNSLRIRGRVAAHLGPTDPGLVRVQEGRGARRHV